MMKTSHHLKLGFVLIAMLAVAGWLVLYPWGQKEKQAPAPLNIVPDQVDLQAKDILYTEVGRGDIRYEIRAHTVSYQKKESVVDFEKVHVKLIMPGGAIHIITSDRGSYHTEDKNMSMAGNVVVNSAGGDRITTDKLYYTDAGRKIHTSSPVTLVNKNIEVRGIGLRVSLDEKQLTLLSHVKATTVHGR